MKDYAEVIGRLLLVFMFLLSGVGKIAGGFLWLAVHGPGRLSLHTRSGASSGLRRKRRYY